MMLVSLAPVCLLGTIVYYQARDTIISQVGERLQAAADLAMSQVDRTFAFAIENIRSWSELEIMQEVSRSDPRGLVSDMLQDYQRSYGVYSNLVVADLNGQVVAAGDKDLVGTDVSQSPWFVHTKNTRMVRVGQLRLDPYIGGYGVAISMPIFKKGSSSELIGILTASFSWSELLAMINKIEVVSGGQNELGYAVLIDREGYIIAAPGFILLEDDGSISENDRLRVYGKRWWGVENPDVLKEMLTEPDHRYFTKGNLRQLVVNSPGLQFPNLKPMGWSLLLVRDAEDALADIRKIRERAILVAAVTTFIIFIIVFFASRHIAHPILLLTQWANELARGRLNSKIDFNSRDEIGQLAQSLENMRQDLKGYLDEIYESKEQFQTLIDSIDCIVWEAEANPVRIAVVNGQTEHVLGHSPMDLLEQMQDWKDWVHPDHVDLIRDAFRHAIETANDGFVEFKARHRSGEWVWLKAFISVVIEGIQVVGLRGVMFDINDIIKAAEEMAQARDIAIKTAERKSQFLAIVSHEIRTPMNGMLGMLELLRDAELSGEHRQNLELALSSGKNLVALVDDVMDFTRLESGEMEFHYERANIQQLFHDAIALIAPEAYRKGLDVGVVQEANLPVYAELDAVKVRQVLSCLLSNALKFTAHGSILLWAEMLSEDRLYVEIKDTGVGIAGEQQDDIFEPFVQEDASTTRRYEGSGLGLSLSKRIIESMGGSIGVKSIKGVGSSFYFELPVKVMGNRKSDTSHQRHELYRRCPDAAALLIGDLPATKMVLQMACQQWGIEFRWEPKEGRVLRQLEEILNAHNYRWIFIAQEMSDRFWARLNPYLSEQQQTRIIQLRLPHEKYGQRPFPHLYVPFTRKALLQVMLDEERSVSESQRSSNAGELPTILVVDDNAVNRKVACGFLKKLGFTFETAEDGQQALELVQKHQYGAILMDCQMPVMDGYQATREIRKYLKGAFLPIIAVTANAMEGDREKCLAAGMDDYIPKPLRKNILEDKLFSWLKKARMSS